MEITAQLTQPASDTQDALLVEALRRGDEAAFVSLVQRYGPLMLRIAIGYVRTQAARRRSSRRPGWACSAASTASRAAPR